MKEKLRDSLPLSLKLWLKRMAVGSLRVPLRLSANALNLARRVQLTATTHGLDMHQAWEVKATPRAPFTQQYGATDFLFLMNALTGRQDHMPAPDRPIRTSIILLCYNKIDLTFQCLRSLLREVDLSDTEILVVNNASVDETKQVLAYFDGYIRAVNNDTNLGFVDGNNKGASVARGKYLLFLNNDTVVLPGWLEHLVETAEDDPQVGVVGPMFIYPDWTLQEAGSIVWKNAEAFHYGWGRSPDDRRFNFAREVDYITGASLLIRKDLFDQLGGFDRLYAPIYYEDTDICFGARSLGYKVVYQPLSRIIHFEGATAGTDTRVGLKRFQVINREKFHEKWRDVLEREQYSYAPALIERAANRKRGPYVLVIDDRFPTPDRDAGSARMLFILKALAKRCKPVFIPISKQEWPEEEKRLWKAGIETARIVDYKRLIKQRKFAAAVLSRPHVAAALISPLRRAVPAIEIVFDMVDTHFIRYEREWKLTGDAHTGAEAKRYRKLETRIARLSDLIWCNSSADKMVMEQAAPGVRIEVIPTIHHLHERGKPFAERAHLLFLGNFIHRPNSDAIRYFAQEIFPLVRKAIPDAQLYVVGDNAPPDVVAFASENVKILGYVPDLEPLWQSCRMLVAPLRFGAGVKGKIGEALAHGLPVVTTSIGAEGMGLRHGAEAMIADAPQDFAACVAEVYHDRALWQRLADNGYRHLAKHFTPPVIEQVIYDSLSALDIEVRGQYEEKSEVRSQKPE